MIIQFGKPANKKQWERRFFRFLENMGVNEPVYLLKSMQADNVSFEMLLEVRGKLEGTLICHGSYESHMQQLFGELGRDEGVILDIGANIGLHSLYFGQKFPHASVLAFEASPRVFKDLKMNSSLNDCNKLEVFNLALGSEAGEMIFYEPSGTKNVNRGLGSFNPKNVPSDYVEVKVQVDTVDAVLADRNNKDDKVTMIKIDVQGHEHEVLEGASGCLAEHRPVVFMELEMANFNSPEQVLNAFKERFASLNYRAYRISDTKPEYSSLDWQSVSNTDDFDALFIPE